jgi:hypothetical protein
MKNKAITATEAFYGVLGIALIALGLIFNMWFIARVASYDGILETTTKIKVSLFDIVAVCSGLLLVKYRKVIRPMVVARRMYRAHPKTTAILFSISFTALVLVFLELVFLGLNLYRANKYREICEGYYFHGAVQYDDLLGYRPKPDVHSRAVKKRDGKVVFDAVYDFDAYGRRVTPVHNRDRRNKYLIFFGGSYVFGEGVNNDETTPYRVAERAPGYMPYNYAFCGYGTQQMLARLQEGSIEEEIEESDGAAIYFFIDDHVSRVIGRLRIYVGWGHNMPYYTIDEEGALVRKGDFTSGRPWTTRFYNLIGRSAIIRFFKINFPLRITEDHIRLTCRVIEESRDLYREAFGNDNFYVVFYPGARYAGRLKPYLEKAGIRYVDYAHLFDRTDKRYVLSESDTHPTPFAHKTIAGQLVKDIEELRSPED